MAAKRPRGRGRKRGLPNCAQWASARLRACARKKRNRLRKRTPGSSRIGRGVFPRFRRPFPMAAGKGCAFFGNPPFFNFPPNGRGGKRRAGVITEEASRRPVWRLGAQLSCLCGVRCSAGNGRFFVRRWRRQPNIFADGITAPAPFKTMEV